MVDCCCVSVRNAVYEFDCTLDTWDTAQSGHGPFALWPGVAAEVSLHRSLARGFCWHILRTRNRHGCSCYLGPVLAKMYMHLC
jgi:hypothetical protein